MNAISPKPEIYGQAHKDRPPLNPVPGVDAPDPERGFHIGTYTGHWFYFKDPRAGDFWIEDIAHALSNNCRYNGHVKQFYSVAEHCWWVSHHVPAEDALAGLMHDAAEAYTSDIPSPMKWHINQQADNLLHDLEETVDKAIFEQFGLGWPMPGTVKPADRAMLYTEMKQLLAYGEMFIPEDAPTFDMRLECWLPERAEKEFLNRFQALAS